jgi:hypothetical protein
MFTIMLDLCFKYLWIIENYVGCGATVHFVSKYDTKAMSPLFMDCLIDWILLPTSQTSWLMIWQ